MIIKMTKTRTVSVDGFSQLELKRGRVVEVSADIGRSLVNGGSAEIVQDDPVVEDDDEADETAADTDVAAPALASTQTFEPKTPLEPKLTTRAGNRKPVAPKKDGKAESRS